MLMYAYRQIESGDIILIFDVQYHDLDVIVITDFIAKRLTLQADPELDQKRKARLAEFFEILTEPDYYVTREMEESEDALKIPGVFQKLAIVSSVVLPIRCRRNGLIL